MAITNSFQKHFVHALFLLLVIWAQMGSATESHNTTERYKIFTFDFERVELPYVICLWILIVALAKIVFHLNHKLPTVIPESCLLIVLGLIVGAILHYSHVTDANNYIIDPAIFFIYILPPIIFDAGYFMPVRAFFDNIGTILLFAVVNTCISAGLIGIALYGVVLMGWVGRDIAILNCFIFSSLISAVDPVAVISVFEEVHVNQMLYIIVFGESLLNDGVTVVLYHMMEGFIEIGESNIIAGDVATGLGSFFIISIGGSLIGILFGFFGGFIAKFTEHVKVIEPLFVFVIGYLMYLTSEMLHWSGILALSFGGIVLRHYFEANVSRKTKTSVKYFMKMLANISETIIFMFLGLSTFGADLDWNWSFICFALLFCLIFRVLGVMVLAFFLNYRRLVKLTLIDQFIMAFGGLRGGIAFCLALSINEELIPERKLFITTTIVIIFFTVFVQGIFIKPVVNALKVKKQNQEDPTLNEKIHESLFDHLMAGLEGITQSSGHNYFRIKFRHLNHKYLKPIFIKDVDTATKADKVINVYHSITEQQALSRAETLPEINGGQKIPLLKAESKISGYSPNNAAVGTDDLYINGKVLDNGNLHHILDKGIKKPHRIIFSQNISDVLENETLETPIKQHHLEPVESVKRENVKHVTAAEVNDIKENKEAENQTLVSDKENKESKQEVSADKQDVLETQIVEEKNTEETTSSDETATEKELPWKYEASNVPRPSLLSLVSTEDEPVTAEAPSWVDNLSYSHLKDTGSPYASPEVTIIKAPPIEKKIPIFEIFSRLKEEKKNEVTIPPPWSFSSEKAEELPIASPCIQGGDKTCNYLLSNHTSAPPTYHVIIPSIPAHDGSISQNSSEHGELPKPLKTLPGSASAPDLPKHWQPIEVLSRDRIYSESLLQELDNESEANSRVQSWLNGATADDFDNEEEYDGIYFGPYVPNLDIDLHSDNDADISDIEDNYDEDKDKKDED